MGERHSHNSAWFARRILRGPQLRSRENRPEFYAIDTLADVRETTRTVQPAPVEFRRSAGPRGLALKSIKLDKGFDGYLQNLFKRTNDVYFVAWAWDLSGTPPTQYPGVDANKEICIIPLRAKEMREFLGEGILLFPPRPVSAGLAVRIMIWESDGGACDFGKSLRDVAKSIEESGLSSLLSLISLAAGVTMATLELVKSAAKNLADLIGTILKANSDDYVDFYGGYFDSIGPWTPGEEAHRGNSSEIVLTRL